MFDFNVFELLVIVIVCLLVYKPENLVEMVATVIKKINQFKQLTQTLNQGVSRDFSQLQNEILKLQSEITKKTQLETQPESKPLTEELKGTPLESEKHE